MRWQWITICLAALAAVLLLIFVTYLPETFRHVDEEPVTLPLPVQTNLLAYPYRAADRPAPPVLEYLTYTDRLLLMIDPRWFEKYQGSHTWEELQSSSGSSSFSIHTAWLLHNPSYPQLGIVLRKDPGSDDYRMSGGEVFLPESGLGVSYEIIEETGESRAFLKFKKEF